MSVPLYERLLAERGPMPPPVPHVPLNDRAPREECKTTDELLALLEGPEPPLGLGASEAEAIIGRPPTNLETGEGYEPGFPGVRCWSRERDLVYRRADGRELHYVYEGNLAYALIQGEAQC